MTFHKTFLSKYFSTRFQMTKLRLAVAALLCTLIIAVANVSVLAQPYTPSAVTDVGIRFSQTVVDDHTISYAYSGNIEKPGLVFLHGTPGGWGAFEIYLENHRLQNDFFMVSIDRLGWGASPLPLKQVDGNFALQAKTINAVLKSYPNKKWIIVGHSLGASIAPQVALENPQGISDLLLLAGSLKPSLGGPRWYNRAASTWLVAKLIGETMRRSNREIMALRKQLKAMDAQIKASTLSTHVTVMQGRKDKLVSPKNPAYVEKEWANHFASVEIIELENEGHFLPWRQTPLVVQTLYRLANKQVRLAEKN